MPTLCDRGRRSLSRRSPSSSWLWRLPTRWRALRGNTVRPLIIFCVHRSVGLRWPQVQRAAERNKAATYRRSKSRRTTGCAARQKGIGARHLRLAWVARAWLIRFPPSTPGMCGSRLASGGLPGSARCGSAATNRTEIGSLLAGQSCATALASIWRGVQCRNRLPTTYSKAPPAPSGGARKKGTGG
jgi:hypothetical protein